MNKEKPTKPSYPEWLRTAIIYQIYPQSFQDSNGDGIGDINGIRSRLEYLSQLGINTIWLNPIFDSPFHDAGYDVRDYFKIAPRYGKESDLIALFKEAKSMGIRVILDLVAGHTSNENSLFIKSLKDPKSPESEQFIWMNRDFSLEEGPTQKNYVHNFFPFQPALNFGYTKPSEPWQDSTNAPGPQRNRTMLKEILEFWMNRGADGFRVDMAASMVKEDPNHHETIKLWKDIRNWWDVKFPEGILVAEWSYPSESIKAGFHLDFLLHFNLPIYRSLFFNETGTLPYPDGDCYFDAKGSGSTQVFFPEYENQLKEVKDFGFISLPSANHDFQRLRCGSRGWEGLRPAWVFLMTQAGPPTIYMGDEIGMRFVPETPPKEGSTLTWVKAPNAGAIDGERSGTRTPMQWDRSLNDGFSSATKRSLYLPLDTEIERPTVNQQLTEPNSLIHFVIDLIQLRKNNSALGATADYRCLNTKKNEYPLVVEREDENQRCVIVINPSNRTENFLLDEQSARLKPLLSSSVRVDSKNNQYSISADPFGYAIFEDSKDL